MDKAELQRNLKMSQESVVQLKADVVSLKKKLQEANSSAVNLSGVMSTGTGFEVQLIRNYNPFPLIVLSEIDTDEDSEDEDGLFDDSTVFDTDEDEDDWL